MPNAPLIDRKDNFDINTINTQITYKKLLKKNSITPTAQLKYSKEFNLKFEVWRNIYLLPRYCTKDNILKEFQYKILHRYLGTNKMLYKCGLSSRNTCRLCNLQIETINHVFYECQITYNFWLCFMKWWEDSFHEKVTLTCRDILLGYKTQDIRTPKNLLFNKCILIAKRFIFVSAFKEEPPVFLVFLNRIEFYWQAEKNSKHHQEMWVIYKA